MPDDDTRYTHAVELTVEAFDDGTVVYDGERQQLHHLNPVMGLVWELLDGQTRTEVVEQLTERFPSAEADIASDVGGALDSLLELGLLQPLENPPRDA